MPQLKPGSIGTDSYTSGIIYRWPGLAESLAVKASPTQLAQCWGGSKSFSSNFGTSDRPQDLAVYVNGKWQLSSVLSETVSTQFSDPTWKAPNGFEAWLMLHGKPNDTYIAIPDSWGPMPSVACMKSILPYLGLAQYNAFNVNDVTWTPLLVQGPPVTVSASTSSASSSTAPAGKSASQGDLDQLTTVLEKLGYQTADAQVSREEVSRCCADVTELPILFAAIASTYARPWASRIQHQLILHLAVHSSLRAATARRRSTLRTRLERSMKR